MLIVVSQHQLVIIHEYRIDKGVNQPLLKLPVTWITVPELRKPMLHILPCQLWLLQLCCCDAQRQFFFLLLQFLKPLLCGCSKDALLNSIQHIFDALFRVGKLAAQSRNCHILSLLHGKQCVNDPINLFLVQHTLHCQANNGAFDPVLPDSLFIAAFLTLCISALVIVMHRSGVTLSAFSYHHAFTLAAEQLCGQQKFALFGFGVRGGTFVFLHALLNAIEQILRNNSRNAAGNNHILITILADVFPIFEQRVEAVDIERLASLGDQSA